MSTLAGSDVTGDIAGHPDTAPGERWWPSPGGIVARSIVLAGLLAFVLTLPLMVPDVFHNVVARAVVYAIVAFSMNVLVGYAGQVSLGHAAFVGIGAFTAGVAMTGTGGAASTALQAPQIPFPLAILIAGATGAVAALVLGGVALRVRGLYLAVVTIAYLLFTQETLFNIRAITGGGAGQPVPRPTWASSSLSYIYLCMAVLALIWLFDWRLTKSKAGRAIQAVRDDERVAASWGINITGYKLTAFLISGTIAGIAGALFGAIEEVAVAPSFGLTVSLIFLLMTVVGGLGSRPGIVQGGAFFAILGTLLEQGHASWGEGYHCVTGWGAGAFQRIGTLDLGLFAFGVYGPGPRLFQALVGLGLFVGGVVVVAMLFRRRFSGFWSVIGAIVGTVILLAGGGYLLAGVVSPSTFCVWEAIGPLWEPVIGAVLLLLTLIFFPGGIAQQQEHTIRWLSFGPLHAPEHGGASEGPDAAGGASHGRS